MRKPLIDTTGLVVNIIEIEDGANYTPDAGLELLDTHPGATIGGNYNRDTKTFTPPPDRPEPEPTETEQLRALVDKLAAAGIIDQAITNGVIDTAAVERVGIDLTPAPVKGKVT